MSLDTLIPRDLITLLYAALAGVLGWAGGWIRGRRRESAEIVHITAQADKTSAEARQIDANTNLSLIQAAASALARAERLQQERDHWEGKSFDLEMELKDSKKENSQLITQAHMDNHQLRKQMNFIEMKNLKDEYIALDKPKDSN